MLLISLLFATLGGPPVVELAMGGRSQIESDGVSLTKEEECFLKVLCATKQKIQYGKDSSWSPEQCDAIGHQFIASARRHGYRPGFLAAFAIHESDLREKISRASSREALDKSLRLKKMEFAHDGGLMGVRCIHDYIDPVESTTNPDKRKRREQKHQKKLDLAVCRNSPVSAMPFPQVMNPLDDGNLPGNIEIGTRILADLRDNGVPLRSSPRNGKGVYWCGHKTHAYWSHYNSGIKPPKSGSFYAHSVASIYRAFAEAMGTDTPELKGVTLYVQKNGRKRPADAPLTKRHRELYARIMTCKGTCNQLALVP